MRSLDFSPLFRSTVGFDHMTRMLDAAAKSTENGFPPYNIEKLGDDDYRIVMAVAGFGEDDIDITVQESLLTVAGKARKDDEERQYLHRGIAARAFERRFHLADHIQVQGASLANGMLSVDLRRVVPETMKPRTIKIERAAAAPKTIDANRQAA